MRKQKWFWECGLIVGLLAVLLTGCSGSVKTIDVQQAADQIHSAVSFKDTMAPPADNMFGQLYAVDSADVKSRAVYVSSGATAEEIAVIEATDTEAAGRVKTAMEKRVEDLKEGFEDYRPAEMTKLENPVIVVRGPYVLFVLCDQADTAKSAINQLFA